MVAFYYGDSVVYVRFRVLPERLKQKFIVINLSSI